MLSGNTGSRSSIKALDTIQIHNDYQIDSGMNQKQSTISNEGSSQSYSNDQQLKMSCSTDSYQSSKDNGNHRMRQSLPGSSGLLRVEASDISESDVAVKSLKSQNTSGHHVVGPAKNSNSGQAYQLDRHSKDWRSRKT